MGKKILFPLLGHKYPKLKLTQIESLAQKHNLRIVGGLARRGWTLNDVDILGEINDVVQFSKSLLKQNIQNPIHHCGTHAVHSHIKCAFNGIKLTFTGKGF